jgi:hypothetical protein
VTTISGPQPYLPGLNTQPWLVHRLVERWAAVRLLSETPVSPSAVRPPPSDEVRGGRLQAIARPDGIGQRAVPPAGQRGGSPARRLYVGVIKHHVLDTEEPLPWHVSQGRRVCFRSTRPASRRARHHGNGRRVSAAITMPMYERPMMSVLYQGYSKRSDSATTARPDP